ncbi:poly-gamma-glutamate hydrolase family protein [Actinoplanes sp. M2I2]|uniref:poly-gamma-glutamate hydrolase family protein n=1 Tax=Actinoplanes sp. M2I2 TaxID=1734444 RepID=UPI0020211AEC|nr:poly-gamma-glutamate hydrolase family protein [Actinoplanes sp. M2I2]
MVVTGARPGSAADTYPSNTALYADLAEGVDYARRFRRHAALDDSNGPGDSYPDTAVVALHGGGIEPGTSELCLAVAGYHPAGGTGGTVYDYWMFEGIRPSGNAALHVTSVHCDDPVALATVAGSRRVLSLHGCSPAEAGLAADAAAVLVGRRDTGLKTALLHAYRAAGVPAIDAAGVPALNGEAAANIVNRNLSGAGVQLELTTPLRTGMFGTNTRTRRKHTTLAGFWTFVNATRQALAG